jgi:hypothetical protein
MKFNKICALSIPLVLFIFISGCKDNSTSSTQTSSNMSLVGSYDTPDYAYDVYTIQINSQNYAFVADGNSGLQIIKVTTPSSPTLVSNYNTAGTALGVTVSLINGSYYAFVSDGVDGLVVLNVNNITAPQLDTVLHFPNDRVLTSFVDTANKNLFVGTYYGNIYIYSLANLPNSVSWLSSYTSPIDHIMGLYVTGGLIYAAENSIGMEIINATNPSTPVGLSYYDTPGLASDIVVGGSYAFVADATSLYIINVSNPFNPTFTGIVSTSGAAYYGVALNYPFQAFTADYDFGVETFGVGVPSNPIQLGYYNTGGRATNLVYFNGYIFVADGADGLIILKYL